MSSIVVGFVINKEKEMLLLHRIDRDEREPVKGGIENGEQNRDAMCRELREETGYDANHIKDMTEIEKFIKLGDHTGFVGAYYLISLCDDADQVQINSLESEKDHDRFQWVGLDTVLSIKQTRLNQEKLEILLEYIH